MAVDDSTPGEAASRFLTSMRELSALHARHGGDPERLRRAAAAIVAQWVDPDGSVTSAASIADRLRDITAEDRALLGDALRVIVEWLRQPGETTGQRVDAVIERMRRELGPLLGPPPQTRRTVDQDRLRASVRESIALRLQEARASQQQAE